MGSEPCIVIMPRHSSPLTKPLRGGLVVKWPSWSSSSRPATLASAFAQQMGIPRSTLQHWLKRKQALDANRALVAFFESPTGLAFLHRLVGACHLTFTQQGACGLRLVCEFLRRTGLDHFVASSFGSQQAIAPSSSRRSSTTVPANAASWRPR